MSTITEFILVKMLKTKNVFMILKFLKVFCFYVLLLLIELFLTTMSRQQVY